MDEWMDGSVVVVVAQRGVSVAARRTPVPTISTFGTLDLAEPVSAISPSPYFQHSLKAKTHTLKTSHRHDRCGDGRRAMMEMVMAASRSSSVISLGGRARLPHSLALRPSHRARERERPLGSV